MPWPSAVQTATAAETPPVVPDPDLIRRAALQRSWERDKEVSRRRLRVRWALWAASRYGLPLLLVLGTAMAVWIWGLPHLTATLEPFASRVTAPWINPVGTPPQTTPPVAPSARPSIGGLPVPHESATSVSDSMTDPLPLRATGEFPASGAPILQATPQAPTMGADAPASDTSNPVLKPDPGLPSKEP